MLVPDFFFGGGLWKRDRANMGSEKHANLRCTSGLDFNIIRITPLENILDRIPTNIARNCHPEEKRIHDKSMSNESYLSKGS